MTYRSRSVGLASSAVAIVLAVGALSALVAFVPTRSGSSCRRCVYAKALRRALENGPTAGTWRITEPHGARTRVLVAHPTDPTKMLYGRTADDAPPPDGPGAPDRKRLRAWSRERLGLLVSEAPVELFFRNYAPTGPAVPAALDDGTAAMRVDWVPRHDFGGETGRSAWFAAADGTLLRLEDRTHQGRVFHGLVRLSADPGPVREGDSASQTPSRPGDPKPPWHPKPASAAPFAVPAPAYLPPGFEVVREAYVPARAPGDGAREEGGSVHLTYSDGLGSFTLIVAPKDVMARIDEQRAKLAARAPKPEPGTCPTLPSEGTDVESGGLVIRRKADACHTVLRVDDVGGLSAVLMSRNELPGDEYVKVIRSLAPAAASSAPPVAPKVR